MVLSHLLNYFDFYKASTNFVYEQELIKLLTEFLLKVKHLIAVDASYLNKTNDNIGDEKLSIYEATIQTKSLSQFARTLADTKYACLVAQVTTYLSETCLKPLSMQTVAVRSDLCILAPFLKGAHESMLNMTKLLFKQIDSAFDETLLLTKFDSLADKVGSMEQNCLLMSLCTWYLIMQTESNEATALSLKDSISLLLKCDQMKSKIITDKCLSLIQIERCLNHLLRTCNYCVLACDELEPIEAAFDVLKNQLSSPYHEVSRPF